MKSMQKIDLYTWKRLEHFNFFSRFADPSYGLVAEIDCTVAYRTAKASGHSFFAWYLHKSLLAVNSIPEFMDRIIDGQPVSFNKIHASATIGRSDETFAYSFIPFSQDFATFNASLQHEIKTVSNSTGLRLDSCGERRDVIYYSSIPWVSFTGLTHALPRGESDSVPKITFGKAAVRGKKRIMPVAVFVHHALADGLHIGKFLTLFQELMNQTS